MTRISVHSDAAGRSTTRVNLVPNPNLETDATRYTAGASTLTRSTTWALTGVASLRVDPTGSSNNDSFAAIDGDTAPFTIRLGLTAGATYTFAGTVNTPSLQTGTLNARARKIAVFASANNGSSYTISESSAGPTTGSGRVSVTATMPAGLNVAFIRLYNGSSVTGEYVYWDNISVVEEGSLGTYFDGDSSGGGKTYAWTGTTRSSPSTEI